MGPLLGLQYVDGGVPLAVDPSFLKAISTRLVAPKVEAAVWTRCLLWLY